MACTVSLKKGVKTADPLQASRVKDQAPGPFWQKTKNTKKIQRKENIEMQDEASDCQHKN